jgi:putative protein kinase ArgK-like GTPase of G3E family
MAELKFAAHLHYASSTSAKDIDWEIPVLSAQAQADAGIAELLGEIRRHRETLAAAGALGARRERRRREELRAVIVDELHASVQDRLGRGELAQPFDDVAAGRIDVYTAARAILDRLLAAGA